LVPLLQHFASAISCPPGSDTKFRQGSGLRTQRIPTAALPARPAVCRVRLHTRLGFVLTSHDRRLLGGIKLLIWDPQGPGKDPCAELHQIKEFMLQAEILESKSML